MSTILLITFFVLVLIGVPISITLGISGAVALIFFSGYNPVIIVQRMFQSVNSFPLMAIPFFILAGSLMSYGGISKRIVDFCMALVGRITGGLALVGIVASMVFASISGSGVATLAAIGGLMIPEMIRRGYPVGFSTAILTASGPMGPIIPPSIGFVIYASMADVSVRDMFLGGYGPGILMGLALMIVTFIRAKGGDLPKADERTTPKQAIKAFILAAPALLTPIIIMGGIMFGIFSPTEAGAIGCVYAVIVGLFIYKELNFMTLISALKEAAITSTVCLFLICTASVFAWVLTVEKIPQVVATSILAVSSSKYVALLLVNVFLLIVGCFIDITPAQIMLTPVLLPVMLKLGVDPIHFGVMLVLNLVIGQLTPPVGSCLFVGVRIGNITLVELVRNIWPMILSLMMVLFLTAYIPQLVLFMPGLFK